MKRILITILTTFAFVAGGCSTQELQPQIVATTLPVYEFTAYLCQNTELRVERLITENVSCLHDYTLKTKQMRAAESAQLLILSGAGLDDFVDGVTNYTPTTVNCANGIHLICSENESAHQHNGEHHHDKDPHIWLSPTNAKIMVENIYNGLISIYPEHREIFQANRVELNAKLDELEQYGKTQLQSLSSRELITFHDGFSYLAQAFDLTVLHAIEEESGSEASAGELIKIIQLIEDHNMKAIFTESSSSVSAAQIISAEARTAVFELDMCMGKRGYFDAMYHNIDTLKEALE